jgi:predicted phosphoadenosine phosphosulfate sulfurtransferase
MVSLFFLNLRDQWNSLKGKSQKEATKLYVELLDSISPKWRDWKKDENVDWVNHLDSKLYENGLVFFFQIDELNDEVKQWIQKFNNGVMVQTNSPMVFEFKNLTSFKEFITLSNGKINFKEFSLLPKMLKSNL